MIKLFGLIFSILLHLILLFLFLYQPEKYPPKAPPGVELPTPPKPFSVRLVPPDTSITPDVVIQKEGKNRYPTDEIICNGKDKRFTGIGIIYNPGSHVIIHAPPFYPGYKAGLREGDMILNVDAPVIDGYIDIEAVRAHNGTLRFHIKADNICYNEE